MIEVRCTHEVFFWGCWSELLLLSLLLLLLLEEDEDSCVCGEVGN